MHCSEWVFNFEERGTSLIDVMSSGYAVSSPPLTLRHALCVVSAEGSAMRSAMCGETSDHVWRTRAAPPTPLTKRCVGEALAGRFGPHGFSSNPLSAM